VYVVLLQHSCTVWLVSRFIVFCESNHSRCSQQLKPTMHSWFSACVVAGAGYSNYLALVCMATGLNVPVSQRNARNTVSLI